MRKASSRKSDSGERTALKRAEAEARSSTHSSLPEEIPSAALDQLLAAIVALPLESGERAVVAAMVDALAALLPRHAIGACFVPEPGSASPGQLVVKRVPEGVVESSAGIDPTRVFPALAQEHVADIPGSTAGSTLHVASDDDPLTRTSTAVLLVERAAVALGRAVSHARQMSNLNGAHRVAAALQERMIQADKLATLGQIAAGIVHELNNPLTSIVAYSDYLIRRAASGIPQDGDDVERLRRISESANRMLRFTRDFVTYARPSSGQPGPVVLHGVIDQSIAFCEHVLQGVGMSVERRYGADVLTVRGVGEQLVQVFVNLLTNASQAAPERDGRVLLSTALLSGGRRVRVVVEDNGGGIADAHLAQIFEPFFTTKSERHGTGLGLSIVKSIVDGHDGAIWAESELGRGARFVLELPVWQRT